ncbi:indole-3-acetic acid inducible 5 [Actinidia rufa]|uniref:Auxin-responsive protein n=1 Tax=Actinidia rufa TaxID=165716 RepID=A0A7J0DBN7_9ERIC|nr:indole-3-acetic acid inducible 5 [Actinidia rufa]
MTMELQLGLALPNNITEGFDLNSRGSEPLSHVGSCLASESGIREYNSKKRSFDEAFVPQTLALLVWNKQPNEEDEGHSELDKNSSTISKFSLSLSLSFRKMPFLEVTATTTTTELWGGHPLKPQGGSFATRIVAASAAVTLMMVVLRPRGSKSTYVKVKMEGVAIARKVDVNLHHSYQSLRDTLDNMFGRGLKNVKAYKLTYQDGEGDWLLAGDVPWR